MDTRVSTQLKSQSKQVGYEEKTAAVHDEMKRMNRLPANSSYATHRLRVLNKILQLMSIQNDRSRIPLSLETPFYTPWFVYKSGAQRTFLAC